MSTDKPHVGIFWGVKDESGAISLLTDATPLEDAELRGNFLIYSRGHYDVWESWRALKPSNEAAERDCEFFPRGRVVYHAEKQYFIIYADSELRTRRLVAQIVRMFGLESESYAVKSALHSQIPHIAIKPDLVREKVDRTTLVELKQSLLSLCPSSSKEPLDVQLFKLICDQPARMVERSEVVTMDGRSVTYIYNQWVSEMHKFETTIIGENNEIEAATAVCGEFDANGEFVARPDLKKIPKYTKEIDSAISFKDSVLGSRRLLVTEELEVDDIIMDPQLFRAKIVDPQGGVLSSAVTDTLASAIVLAVLNDLLNNEGASWWIEVTGC